jgi:hypothetical protein
MRCRMVQVPGIKSKPCHRRIWPSSREQAENKAPAQWTVKFFWESSGLAELCNTQIHMSAMLA